MTGTTHGLDLEIAERYSTVANGYVMYLWMIGGTVPGPVVRVLAGDTVRVFLTNHPLEGTYPEEHEAVNRYPHSVVFNGSSGGWEDQLTPIEPGRVRLVEFTTPNPGVWMYHGTQPVLQSVTNGMYGMMIVEPEGGLDSVAQEFFLVQGEWYVGSSFPSSPALPSLEKAAAPDPSPDFVVLNGAGSQYVDNPIQVETGERVRVFILNAGPNLNMAFRVEGVVFDRVIREGIEVDVRGEQVPGSPEVGLSPGQGAMVEFVLAADGAYRILTQDDGDAVTAGLFEAVSGRL
jgi:nitrite reductase (NO-forming)